MKKGICGIVLSVVLLASMAPSAVAAWQPSKTQQGVTGADAAVIGSNGAQTKIDIFSQPPKDSEGNAEDLSTAASAYIKITPVEQTLKANADHDAIGENGAKTFWEKAHDRTESGLRYSVNEDTNLVYRSVQKADSTARFLNSVNGEIRNDVEQAIQARVETQKTELAAQAAELEAGIKALEAEGKTQEAAEKRAELDAVNAALEKISQPDYTGVDNYSPLALFDVSASAGALEQFGDGTSVLIEVEVDGVNAQSDLIGIHFFGELDDYDAVKEGLEQDYDNTVMQYEHEILEVTPTEDGKVRFYMTHFSPVMILTRVDPVQTPVTGPVVDQAPENEPAGTNWTWLIVLIVILLAAVIGGGVYRHRKNRKKTTSAK